MSETSESLLDAPCLWCSYNGSGYYQIETHSNNCPWHKIGGASERSKWLRDNNYYGRSHYKEFIELASLLEAERKKSEEYEKALEWLTVKTYSVHMVNWDRWVVTTKQIEVVGEGTTPLAAIRSAMAKEKEEKKEGGK